MTIAQRIGDAHANAAVSARAGEFVAIARSFAAAKGNISQAMQIAKARNVTPRAQSVLGDWIKIKEGRFALKSAVDPGTTTGTDWAAPLAQYDGLAAAFLDSLRSVGAFDGILPSMIQVPLRARIGVVSAGASATVVGQGQLKPLSSLSLAGNELDERKAIAALVVTAELAKLAGPEAMRLFTTELQKAVASTTDSEFISIITTGAVSLSSSGTTLAALREDLRNAFNHVDGNAASRYAIVMGAATAKAVAFLDEMSDAFIDMSPTGGTIAKVPVYLTDAAQDDIIVLDAAQIAANGGTVDLGELRHASLQMQTTPDSPVSASTTLVNLWQQNQIGLTAERFFGVEKLRADCAAVITGNTYGGGNSPA